MSDDDRRESLAVYGTVAFDRGFMETMIRSRRDPAVLMAPWLDFDLWLSAVPDVYRERVAAMVREELQGRRLPKATDESIHEVKNSLWDRIWRELAPQLGSDGATDSGLRR